MKVEKLVVGVIGLGMGANHLKGAINYGAEIGGICDTNPEKLAKALEDNNLPAEIGTADYHDIVNNKNINEQARGDSLTTSQFVELTKLFDKKEIKSK